VKIRDGIHTWPPVWTRVRTDGDNTIRGEVGLLKYVYSNPRVSNKCYLVIEHEHEKYVGALIFDDRASCNQVLSLLRNHLGRPIEEIGGLEISYSG
jgi:hypothetical protein